MRRSGILFKDAFLREGHQYGWYERYMKLGPQGFKKNHPPTPFDWSKPSPLNAINSSRDPLTIPGTEIITSPIRPRAYFDLKIDVDIIGRIQFELADDIVPKTVENFKRLCLGMGPSHLNNGGYIGSKFHLVRKNEVIMGGDIEKLDGSLSHSSYPSRFFEDENFIIPHSERGLISMASRGRHTNGSQFYIDLTASPHLNASCVVFGRVIEGDEVLKELEKVFTVRSVPVRDVVIADAGYLDRDAVAAIMIANAAKSNTSKKAKTSN